MRMMLGRVDWEAFRVESEGIPSFNSVSSLKGNVLWGLLSPCLGLFLDFLWLWNRIHYLSSNTLWSKVISAKTNLNDILSVPVVLFKKTTLTVSFQRPQTVVAMGPLVLPSSGRYLLKRCASLVLRYRCSSRRLNRRWSVYDTRHECSIR